MAFSSIVNSAGVFLSLQFIFIFFISFFLLCKPFHVLYRDYLILRSYWCGFAMHINGLQRKNINMTWVIFAGKWRGQDVSWDCAPILSGFSLFFFFSFLVSSFSPLENTSFHSLIFFFTKHSPYSTIFELLQNW